MRAELRLPIFKVGDDIDSYLEKLDNVAALSAYAATLDETAAMVRAVAEGIKDFKVEIFFVVKLILEQEFLLDEWFEVFFRL